MDGVSDLVNVTVVSSGSAVDYASEWSPGATVGIVIAYVVGINFLIGLVGYGCWMCCCSDCSSECCKSHQNSENNNEIIDDFPPPMFINDIENQNNNQNDNHHNYQVSNNDKSTRLDDNKPIRLSLYMKPVDKPLDDACTICLCPLSEGKTMKTKCNHQFHTPCISEWEEKSKEPIPCPMCRADLY